MNLLNITPEQFEVIKGSLDYWAIFGKKIFPIIFYWSIILVFFIIILWSIAVISKFFILVLLNMKFRTLDRNLEFISRAIQKENESKEISSDI